MGRERADEPMNASILFGGILSLASGAAALVPLAASFFGGDTMGRPAVMVLSLAVILMLAGAVMITKGRRQRVGAAVPPPVRAAILGNILFLAFFVLEFSDGLLRQHGRVFYWTSVLFVPALLLFYGLVSGRNWAWWTARGVAAILILWFVAFIVIIPFGDFKRGSEVTPWYGRLYMMAFTLLLGSVVFAIFRALGSGEARRYFGR